MRMKLMTIVTRNPMTTMPPDGWSVLNMMFCLSGGTSARRRRAQLSPPPCEHGLACGTKTKGGLGLVPSPRLALRQVDEEGAHDGLVVSAARRPDERDAAPSAQLDQAAADWPSRRLGIWIPDARCAERISRRRAGRCATAAAPARTACCRARTHAGP